MAYLLMFVTLLHLITLAMLFIATMEKVVVIFGIHCDTINVFDPFVRFQGKHVWLGKTIKVKNNLARKKFTSTFNSHFYNYDISYCLCNVKSLFTVLVGMARHGKLRSMV